MGGGGVGGGGGGGGGRLEREIQRMDDAHKRELQDLSLSLLEQSNERARDIEVLPRARAPKLRARASGSHLEAWTVSESDGRQLALRSTIGGGSRARRWAVMYRLSRRRERLQPAG